MSVKLRGKTAPRLWTPPLRTLTRRTSLGYELAEFAGLIGSPFDPWQRWLGIHMLELNRDGSLRFRICPVIAGRQCGKSTFAAVLCLYFLYVRGAQLVLSAAQDLSRAREHERFCLDMIRSSPWLASELGHVHGSSGDEWFRVANGSEDEDGPVDVFSTAAGGRYKITAANRKAGRGASADLLFWDELRESYGFDGGWSALSATTLARPDALIVAMSNAGDSRSVVLSQLRESALAGKDPGLGLFEWSAPPAAALDDTGALRQAMPGLGHSVSLSAVTTLIASQPATVTRTEIFGQWVDLLNQAIDYAAWTACHDPAGDLSGARDRISACVDVSPDGEHVTLALAAPAGNQVRVEVRAAWPSTEQARAELPAMLAKIRPRVISWFPGGPAGVLATTLRPRPGTEPPPLERARPGMPAYAELTGVRVSEACMTFADLVRARLVLHPGDELLNNHVRNAEKMHVGSDNAYRFTRKGGHCDAVYAASGAVALALQIPAAKRARVRLLEAG
jgi:hypothetical protein